MCLNEKQQIEKMALTICKNRGVANVDNCKKCRCHEDCLYQDIACSLHREDYRKKNEWTSVDENAPEKWELVLCYYPEKSFGSKVVVDYAETDNGGFAQQFQYGKPSHWMPLPKPPKMKGSDTI